MVAHVQNLLGVRWICQDSYSIPFGDFEHFSYPLAGQQCVWFNVIQSSGRHYVELIKLAVKALVFERWSDISSRPAVPV